MVNDKLDSELVEAGDYWLTVKITHGHTIRYVTNVYARPCDEKTKKGAITEAVRSFFNNMT